MTVRVAFFRPTGRHGFLSNFYEGRAIEAEIDGERLVARTAEALFQAAKFPAGSEARRAVLAAPTPKRAKALGQQRGMRADWDEVRVDVMRAVLRAKFTDPEMRTNLLATGTAELVEASPFDVYWGTGADGSGRNMLGRLLMELRASLA